MVSEQPTRKMVREFLDAGWTKARTRGSHSLWQCPADQHTFTLPDGHRTISPGVVDKARKALANCNH